MPDCQKDPGPAVERARPPAIPLPLFWAPQNIACGFRRFKQVPVLFRDAPRRRPTELVHFGKSIPSSFPVSPLHLPL
ncbi:hypothetical protein BDZ89DRAFT_1085836, partial [Hymenopellis radicata]